MKINKQELQEALKIVRPGLGDGKAIEQSTSFAFVGNKVVTYNDRISISHPVENLDITGAVKAEELYRLLEKIKRDEIDLEISDSQIIIKAGRSKASFQLKEEITLPILDCEDGDWVSLPKNFSDCLNFAYPVCSQDMSRLMLTCINVTKSQVIASDGFRILIQSFTKKIKVEEFLLPGINARVIASLNPVEIMLEDAWVHFKTESGAIIHSRRVEGEFPKVSPHFISEGTHITFPEKINEMLDRARIFAKQEFEIDERIGIQLKDKKITVSSKSNEGAFEEKSKIDYDGEEVNFQITPILFEHILKQTFSFLFGQNRVQFEGENWKYLVMLRGTDKK